MGLFCAGYQQTPLTTEQFSIPYSFKISVADYAYKCPPRSAICGVYIHIEGKVIFMACCEIANPSRVCEPRYEWKNLGICSNNLTCEVKITIGTQSTYENEESRSFFNSFNTEFRMNAKAKLPGFSASVETTFGFETSYKMSTSSLFREVNESSTEMTVNFGECKGLVQQLVLYCGDVAVSCRRFTCNQEYTIMYPENVPVLD
jgi:hypothetical protein